MAETAPPRPHRNQRRWGGWVALALVVVGAAAWFFWPKKDGGPKLTFAKVDTGDIVARVTATGTLSALVTVQVGSQVSGRIQEILVDFNSRVKMGQVIARLDRQLLEAALAESRANHAASIANVERASAREQDAKRQAERARDLAGRKLIAATDLDAAELAARVAHADVVAAQAAFEQAKALLQRAQINVGYATIISPIDGIVISRDVDVGQTVAASLQAPTLFTIAQDLVHMQVETNVGEADIGKLQEGMVASFSVDAYPGERFEGKIRQIRNAPQTIQNVVTYDVIVNVDNADLRLRPGMTANVTFVLSTSAGVLRVPNAALRFKPPSSLIGIAPAGATVEGSGKRSRQAGNGTTAPATGGDPRPAPKGEREVWVMRDGRAQRIEVTLGLSDGTTTEVLTGDLKAGDEVITDAIDRAAPAGNRSSGGPSGGIPRRMF